MNQSVGVPAAETGAGDQGYFHLGVGGPCLGDVVPAYGYMCALKGGPRAAGQHMHPIGLKYTADLLPNLPYANVSGAVIHAWRPAHWFTVQWEIGAASLPTVTTNPTAHSSHHSRNSSTDAGAGAGVPAAAGSASGTAGTFDFVRGGFQGGEGFPAGAEWFIENVEEELDSPLEYYYNDVTKELLFVPNGTAAALSVGNARKAPPPVPPSGTEFVATNLKVLFDVQGTADAAVKDVTLRGLVLTDTAVTFLDDHGT